MATTANGFHYPAPSDPPDGSGAVFQLATDVDNALNPGWVSYFPSTGAFGFTGLSAFYRRSGKRIAVKFFGTWNASGNGQLLLQNPVTADTGAAGSTGAGVRVLPSGKAYIRHGGNVYDFGLDMTADGTNVQFTYPGANGQITYVTNTLPFAWAAGDNLTASYSYEVA